MNKYTYTVPDYPGLSVTTDYKITHAVIMLREKKSILVASCRNKMTADRIVGDKVATNNKTKLVVAEVKLQYEQLSIT